jgi:C4-type Zn-finger protein
MRVRCPICKKLVKNLETPERLPLNINILYEVVESDPLLSAIDFDDENQEAI